MSALYILIAISICVAIVFLVSFLWAVNRGQFDDDYTPSVRILFDDPEIQQPDEPLKKEL
jgi:cbb3-type cytochrome oxidase maturation protein